MDRDNFLFEYFSLIIQFECLSPSLYVFRLYSSECFTIASLIRTYTICFVVTYLIIIRCILFSF